MPMLVVNSFCTCYVEVYQSFVYGIILKLAGFGWLSVVSIPSET